MIKTRDNKSIVVGTNGRVVTKRLDNISSISSFKVQATHFPVQALCELQDGSFVGGFFELKHWDTEGRIIKTFSGNEECILRVIELKSDVIVGASVQQEVMIWRVSTGECLRRTTTVHSHIIAGLQLLSEGKFVTASTDETIRVWDYGECIQTIKSRFEIFALLKLRSYAIVTASTDGMEIRQLK